MSSGPRSAFLDALHSPGPTLSVELRPPPASLMGEASVDAWIDLNQSVRGLLRDGRFVLFTDDAVGEREEESLQHLTANLGAGADLSGVVPFLTCKHSSEYSTLFARRASAHGLGAITVTGGDWSPTQPRRFERSRDLRRWIRERVPDLPLGSWVNPFRDPVEQVELLLDPEHMADYYLTQVVSHHNLGPISRFLEEGARRGLALPGLVGVFYYRSARATTLSKLAQFIPVPVEGLAAEFSAGAAPDEICARTLSSLSGLGVGRIYLSNLPQRGTAALVRRLERLAGLL